MKRFTKVIFIVLFFCYSIHFAQNTTSNWEVDKRDVFNNAKTPIMDGTSMWVLRQNLTLEAYEIKLNYENRETANTPKGRFLFVNYLPIYKSNSFAWMAGMRYDKSNLMPESKKFDAMDIHHIWFWNAVDFKISGKTKFFLVSEFYQRGNNDSFLSTISNQYFFFAGFARNFKNWQLMVMAGYDWQWRDKGIHNKILTGFQIKWIPNKDVKLIVGMPVLLGIEWKISELVQVGGYFLSPERNSGFVQFRLCDSFSLSGVFRSQNYKSNKTYFERTTYSEGDNNYLYNNLIQAQISIGIEAALDLSHDIAFILSSGYTFGDELEMNLDNFNILDLKGGKGLYFGAGFHLLKF